MTRHRRDAYDTLHAATFMLTLLERLSLLPFAFLLLPFPCPLRHLTRPYGKTIQEKEDGGQGSFNKGHPD